MGQGIESVPGSAVALCVPSHNELWGIRSPVYRGLRPLHGNVHGVPGSHLWCGSSTAVKLYERTPRQGMLQ